MADLEARLTQTIRLAEQQVANAARQQDHLNWTQALGVLREARDELSKPQRQVFTLADAADKLARAANPHRETLTIKDPGHGKA